MLLAAVCFFLTRLARLYKLRPKARQLLFSHTENRRSRGYVIDPRTQGPSGPWDLRTLTTNS